MFLNRSTLCAAFHSRQCSVYSFLAKSSRTIWPNGLARPSGRPNRFITVMKSLKRVAPSRAINCRLTMASFIHEPTRQCILHCRRSAAMRSQCDFLAVRFSSSVNLWRRFGLLSKFFDLLCSFLLLFYLGGCKCSELCSSNTFIDRWFCYYCC